MVNYQGYYLLNGKYYNYHEKGFGVLTGGDGIADYTIEYVANQHFIWLERTGMNFVYTIPMLLKHEGKLVAVIHESYQGIFHFDGERQIVDRYILKTECH